MHVAQKSAFLIILGGLWPCVLLKKSPFLVILVGYRPCILLKKRAFLVILVGYRPCILLKKRPFLVILMGYRPYILLKIFRLKSLRINMQEQTNKNIVRDRYLDLNKTSSYNETPFVQDTHCPLIKMVKIIKIWQFSIKQIELDFP